jgi:muramoyltetrapeptide carboxypeptidase
MSAYLSSAPISQALGRMRFPPYLLPGDRVAIISPAGKVERLVVERGAELLSQQGFEVKIGRHAFGEDGVFSATDVARAADMQEALDDESIKAIFFSRGGYGCLRTHLRLDWSSFFRRPKWLVGFSDVSVFHAHLSRHHVASIHGVMPSSFERDQTLTGRSVWKTFTTQLPRVCAGGLEIRAREPVDIFGHEPTL